MEITINLQLADRVEQYSVDLIDIVAAYKLAKKWYFKDIEYEQEDLKSTVNIALQNLIVEQVAADLEKEILNIVEDENLALLESYVAKVVYVLEL